MQNPPALAQSLHTENRNHLAGQPFLKFLLVEPSSVRNPAGVCVTVMATPESTSLFATAHSRLPAIVCPRSSRQNLSMRFLAGFLVLVGAALAIYYYSLQQTPSSDPGTAPTQAISLTGVRADLLQIAQAERGQVALHGQCASLSDLISSGALSMSRSERDGYSYTVDCSGADFAVTARHASAPAGSPIRYPTLGIDPSMQVRELQ